MRFFKSVLALFIALSLLFCLKGLAFASDNIDFFDRYDGQALVDEHYTGDLKTYLQFLSSYYNAELSQYDNNDYAESFYTRELLRAYNGDFPHAYLVGQFEENGEVTITGLKARDFYIIRPSDGLFAKYDVKVESIVIPDEIEGHPVTKIADNAFAYHEEGMGYGKADVVIGDNVRIIGKGAFYENEYIRSVTFGKNVEEICNAAFWGCYGLEQIKAWGEHLQTIGSSAFGEIGSYTEKGTSFSPFPMTLQIIGSKAFLNAIVRDEIVIPETTQKIGDLALATWNSIQSLIVLNRDMDIENTDTSPLLQKETDSVLYCYAQSTAEDNAKRFGYTYHLIDGASLLFDGAAVEGDALRVPTALTEAEFLARAASDGGDCEIRLSGLRDGKVTTGTTVTLWNTKVDAAGKVYTVRKDAEVETVSVSAPPTKTDYRYKEVFDPTGLALAVTYDDGTTATVADGFTLQGADNLKVGTNTITVTYADRAATFDVTVKYTWWQYLIRIFLLGFLWY